MALRKLELSERDLSNRLRRQSQVTAQLRAERNALEGELRRPEGLTLDTTRQMEIMRFWVQAARETYSHVASMRGHGEALGTIGRPDLALELTSNTAFQRRLMSALGIVRRRLLRHAQSEYRREVDVATRSFSCGWGLRGTPAGPGVR